jgi:hypothetical protein
MLWLLITANGNPSDRPRVTRLLSGQREGVRWCVCVFLCFFEGSVWRELWLRERPWKVRPWQVKPWMVSGRNVGGWLVGWGGGGGMGVVRRGEEALVSGTSLCVLSS